MKNRRLTIVAFLLCACLVVGFGYAALADDLDITGDTSLTVNAANDELNSDVYFTEVSDVENCGAVVSLSDNDKIAVTVTDDNSTMALAGDKASFKATIANDSGVDVVLSFAHTASEYIEMCVVNDLGEHSSSYTVTVPANGTAVINVSLELLKNVETDVIEQGTFYVDVTATPANSNT